MHWEASASGGARRASAPRLIWAGLVVLALVASWGISYAVGGAGVVPPHIFYAAILLAAGRFGVPGAVATAVLAGLLAGPLLPLNVDAGTSQEISDWVGRTAFFVGMGSLMGVAFQRLRRSEVTARWRVQRLANLHQIDLDILAAGTYERIADAALARLRSLVSCDRASLTLRERGGLRLLSADSDADLGPEAGALLPLQLPDLERVDFLNIDDVEQTEGLPSHVRSYLLERGLRSVLIGPLRSGREVRGALGLMSRAVAAFSAGDEEVVAEVAAQLSLAFEQARLRDDLRERARELEERVRDLYRSEEVRRRLMARLISAEEQERRSLAESLHDDPIQIMTAVGMQLEVVRSSLDDPAAAERIGSLVERVSETIARLRRLVFELHSPTLERAGLAEAVRVLLEDASSGEDTTWSLRSEVSDEPPSDAGAIAYRVVREAVTKIRKHASASEVEVALESLEGGFVVRITDDGIGFDPASADDRPGHMGLASMRERIELAGGWFRVSSREPSGTLVEFWLPTGERPVSLG